MDLGLDGKIALVSGSTAGIGFATARLLAAEGAHVVINGRTQARVDEALAKLKEEFPRAHLSGTAADLATASGCEALTKHLPNVDILVNNMSIFEVKPFHEIPDSDWTRFFETNVMSGVRLSRHYLTGMLQRNWGRVVFVSSESALQVPIEMIHYGMTKTAQLAVARGLAEMTAGTGVTVNSVLPGPTSSEGLVTFMKQMSGGKPLDLAATEKEFFEKARPGSLLKRFESTDEIASMIGYVVSVKASGTNGAALRVEGGLLRSIA